MRVAILSESPADEAAVGILVAAVLGHGVETIRAPGRRSGGISAAIRAVGITLRRLHYRREADALVVVVDANHSAVHTGPVDARCDLAENCRLCRLREEFARVRGTLSPMPGYAPIRTAVGLAVPAIEAWYLCGREPNVSENAWTLARREGREPYTKAQLKRLVYGTDIPSLRLETECAEREVRRVVDNLTLLERSFAVGFAALAADLRTWPTA